MSIQIENIPVINITDYNLKENIQEYYGIDNILNAYQILYLDEGENECLDKLIEILRSKNINSKKILLNNTW